MTLVPYGEDVPGTIIRIDQVIALLDRLEAHLRTLNLHWREVAMLVLTNSKVTRTAADQAESDQNIRDGLQEFCASRGWSPSLIGATVVGSFFRSGGKLEPDISDGVMIVAVVSSVLQRIPVAHEVTEVESERRFAGARVLAKALRLHASSIRAELDLDAQHETIAETSTGLIFTSGTGHTEHRDQVIDFKDCYAVGQELLDAADLLNAQIVGGCASNRSQAQLQCLYYSTEVAGRVQYRFTYQHGAVLGFLPFARAQLILQHPYKRIEDQTKLDLKFHPHDQYADGRYFYIQEINGRAPIDFLAEVWGFERDQLNTMVACHTAIQRLPKAHLVTLASSLSKYDKMIWPNVPIWLDLVDGRVMLRLVRAEAEDSNYYLMEMKHNYIGENAQRLMDAVESSHAANVNTLAFLCESRKYVLRDEASNAEAEEMLSRAGTSGPVIGIYLNGEYSTGSRQSIGYHNYSQIGVLLAGRPVCQLPREVAEALRQAGSEIFICHGKRDKPAVREFVGYVESFIPGTTHWLDEQNLKAGDAFESAILRAIGRKNQLFLAFLSDRSISSPWVQRELRWAIGERSRHGRPLIIPVILDDRGDQVLKELRDIWGPDLVSYMEKHIHVKITDFTEDEFRAKAKNVADAMAEWLRGFPFEGDEESDFMPGMQPLVSLLPARSDRVRARH
jgi:hypothetical protein